MDREPHGPQSMLQCIVLDPMTYRTIVRLFSMFVSRPGERAGERGACAGCCWRGAPGDLCQGPEGTLRTRGAAGGEFDSSNSLSFSTVVVYSFNSNVVMVVVIVVQMVWRCRWGCTAADTGGTLPYRFDVLAACTFSVIVLVEAVDIVHAGGMQLWTCRQVLLAALISTAWKG